MTSAATKLLRRLLPVAAVAIGASAALSFAGTANAAETPTTGAAAKPKCTVDAKLVPSCGVLWGAAAGGFSTAPRDTALKTFEAKSGRTAAIFHTCLLYTSDAADE